MDILPSQSLGYKGGGSTPIDTEDQKGVKAAEKFFEIRILPQNDAQELLFPGQRVIARIQLPVKPLALQWWNALRQLFQRRYHI